MTELGSLSVQDLAAGVRSGELRALDIVEDCLERTIGTLEPRVSAYLALYEDEARQTASAIDRRRDAGEALGLLAGVPVALKDNLSLEGKVCTCGSRMLAGYIATFTSTAVSKLLAADAVPIGKTNLDEFAMGSSCENSAYQTTRNPWNLDRVPGGSSGGSAAAVACGSVPLALGSDTGGSIRQPAAGRSAVQLRGFSGLEVAHQGLLGGGRLRARQSHRYGRGGPLKFRRAHRIGCRSWCEKRVRQDDGGR